MALINCSECGKPISDSAEICPNCGFKTEFYQMRSAKKRKLLIKSIVIMLVGIFLVLCGYYYRSWATNQISSFDHESYHIDSEGNYYDIDQFGNRVNIENNETRERDTAVGTLKVATGMIVIGSVIIVISVIVYIVKRNDNSANLNNGSPNQE